MVHCDAINIRLLCIYAYEKINCQVLELFSNFVYNMTHFNNELLMLWVLTFYACQSNLELENYKLILRSIACSLVKFDPSVVN